jgi:hypothetical protein
MSGSPVIDVRPTLGALFIGIIIYAVSVPWALHNQYFS